MERGISGTQFTSAQDGYVIHNMNPALKLPAHWHWLQTAQSDLAKAKFNVIGV